MERDEFEGPELCEGCEHPGLRLQWCPAYGQYLCTLCRNSRSDDEFRETARANLAARNR